MQKLPFDLKVGDYCTAYTKGIHRVKHILYPPKGRASTALVTLESVLDRNYMPRVGHKSQCDVSYCVKINKETLLKNIEHSHSIHIKNVTEYLV